MFENMKFILRVSAMLCALIPVSVVQAQGMPDYEPPELSLSTIILFALDSNPDVGIAEAKAGQLRYSVEEARAGLYPQASLSVGMGQDFNDPASGDEIETGQSDVTGTASYNFTVKQLLFDGFRVAESVKQRERAYEAEQIKADVARQKVVTQAIDMYLAVYRNQRSYRQMVDFVRRLEDIYSKIEISYDAGATSKAKLNYAKSRLAFAKSDMQNTRAQLKDSLSSLEFLTGKLPTFAAISPDELDPSVLDMDFYLDMASKHNFDVMVSNKNIDSAEHQLKSQRAKYMPVVNFNVGFRQIVDEGGEVGMERDITSGVELSYDLFDGGKRKSAEERMKIQLNELALKKQKLLKELQKEIKLSYNQILSIQKNMILTDEEIESSREVRRLNYEKFELGEIDIIELIEGEERLNAALKKRNSQEANLYLNTFKLLKQVGALSGDNFCEAC